MGAESIHLTRPPLTPAVGRGENESASHEKVGMSTVEPDWYNSLYERVRSSVDFALTNCPDLSQRRDDLVQKVATRLTLKFEEFQGRYLRYLIPSDGDDTWSGRVSWNLEELLEGLDEVGDWGRLKETKRSIQRSVKIINKKGRTVEEFDHLSDCLETLRALGPDDIYAESYVNKNVLWAIQDARRARKPQNEGAESIDSGSQEDSDRILRDSRTQPASPEYELKVRRMWKRALSQMHDRTRRVVVLAGYGHKQIDIAEHPECVMILPWKSEIPCRSRNNQGGQSQKSV